MDEADGDRCLGAGVAVKIETFRTREVDRLDDRDALADRFGELTLHVYGDHEGEAKEVWIFLQDTPADFAEALVGLAAATKRAWATTTPLSPLGTVGS